MRRGTTPTNKFKTQTDVTGMAALFITYKQQGETVIEKSLPDIDIYEELKTVGDKEVTIYVMETKLSQEDTLALNSLGEVEIQVRGKYTDGTVIACQVIKVPVFQILKEGII